jgi:hypothetical protein
MDRTTSLVLVAFLLAALVFGGAPAPTARADTLCVNPGGTEGCYASIQAAIAAAVAGDTIEIRAGTYQENIMVDKSLILDGAGQDQTILVPAVNGPTCSGGSLCDGHSSVVFIQASSVHIQNMTIDGDNPNLAGGFAQGGADVNARNGIIENYNAGVFDGLEINNVLVKNIYLRGIYASSGGSSFNIHDNTVQNVQGEANSIAIMNFGGSGIFSGNTVDQANDGIVSNWSRGTQYINNTITNSSSGVHTDNAGSGTGDTADLLQGNHVSACKANGYGVWIFVPYLAPTLNANVVEGCAVGLAQFGSRNTSPAVFTNNEVDGAGTSGGAGVYISTDLTPYGSDNVTATLSNNIVAGFSDAVVVEAQTSYSATVAMENNAIEDATNGILQSGDGAFTVTAARNWWGQASGPAVAENPGGAGAVIPSGISFAPWLCADTDTSIDAGFQPSTTLCGLATKLIFSVQPGSAGISGTLYPQPVVRAVDADGNLAINFTGQVTVALDTNPTAANLDGTKTASAAGGDAAFTDLSVDAEGVGYTLKASNPDLGEVISDPFDIKDIVIYLPIISK